MTARLGGSGIRRRSVGSESGAAVFSNYSPGADCKQWMLRANVACVDSCFHFVRCRYEPVVPLDGAKLRFELMNRTPKPVIARTLDWLWQIIARWSLKRPRLNFGGHCKLLLSGWRAPSGIDCFRFVVRLIGRCVKLPASAAMIVLLSGCADKGPPPIDNAYCRLYVRLPDPADAVHLKKRENKIAILTNEQTWLHECSQNGSGLTPGPR